MDAQLVEVAEGLSREVPDLGVVTLRLELGDDDDGEDYVSVRRTGRRLRIAQQNGGVEHVGALPCLGFGLSVAVVVFC